MVSALCTAGAPDARTSQSGGKIVWDHRRSGVARRAEDRLGRTIGCISERRRDPIVLSCCSPTARRGGSSGMWGRPAPIGTTTRPESAGRRPYYRVLCFLEAIHVDGFNILCRDGDRYRIATRGGSGRVIWPTPVDVCLRLPLRPAGAVRRSPHPGATLTNSYAWSSPEARSCWSVG
jgi:hypothetical protein